MKIRTQLTALAAGVMAPLVLIVGLVTYTLWHQQRDAYRQRFLERVSALRLALDTELDGMAASLTASVGSTDLADVDEATFRRRFGRLLESYPGWSAVTLTNPAGRVLARLDRPGKAAAPPMKPLQPSELTASANVLVSGLDGTPGGAGLLTHVAVPVRQGGSVRGLIYATVEHAHWLRFLKTYPVSPHATLTLNDRQGLIIARTLNDDRWAGKPSTSSYLDRTTGKNQGAFESTGLEGQVFYTAFSRSQRAGWLLGTGVPREEVEAALLQQTATIVLVTALALAGAFAAAWLLGGHINLSLTALQAAASAWPKADSRGAAETLPITEAEIVRQALAESATRMHSVEASLNAAVQYEAGAREAAEAGSRAKDAFLAMLGHELRNPLSAITAAIAVLDAPHVSPAASARTRDILARQTADLRQMLGDLIDTAELTRHNLVLQKSRIDLAEIVERVATRFADAGRCSHLRVRLELRPIPLDADPRRLEQVASYLLDNACRYTPSGGSVVVEVGTERGTAFLRVSDDGAGMTADVLPQLFVLFAQGERTIERSHGGLGLGLATAKGLVDLHGGSIHAASDGAGRGSTFTVRLPGGSSLASVTSIGHYKAGLRLTIVEDIADIREVMQLLLATPDRQINSGADGPSGVAAILQGPSDVALVDIGLPGFDGFEVARRVRQSPAGARILLIALTGFGTAEDRNNALAAGFDDFLVKPFDPDLFESRLAAGLQRKGRALAA